MVRAIANYYESIGVLVKTGLVDRELVLQIYAEQVLASWQSLAPVAIMQRRRLGDMVLENFEYLAVLAQDWMAAHPKSTYPAGLRRFNLKDEWLEADKQYAPSLAPA